MKKLLISIMGITLIPLSIAAHAGDASTDKNWVEKKIGRYYQDLDLTAQQKTQLRDIHQKHRLAEDAEVKSVLTPEQVKKWEELKNTRKESYLRDNVDDLKKE